MNLQDFFNLFTQVDFVSIGLTLISGAIWGLMFKNWEMDKRTVFVLVSLYLPLLIGRILYTISTPATEAGYLSLLYYSLYFLGAFLTRKIVHGRIVDSSPLRLKQIQK